jgi:hypothetical protein
MNDWVVGTADLTVYFKKPDWKNCKRYIKRNGIPLLRWPNGQPAIHIPTLNEYLIQYNVNIGLLKQIITEKNTPSKTKNP